MLGANPSSPPIATWQKMSESEQDAPIQAIEVSRRRRLRLAIAFACIGLCATLAIVGYYAQLIPK